MKRSHKAAAGIAAALSLGIGAAAFAQPGNESHHKAGMQHGKMGGHSLMTPEERTALQEKMRNAKTPEERQKLAQATHEEMQKRAKENGATTESDTHTH